MVQGTSATTLGKGARADWMRGHVYPTGIVADAEGEQQLHPGDLAVTPAGHPHWHGATAEAEFVHVTVAASGDEIEIVDG